MRSSRRMGNRIRPRGGAARAGGHGQRVSRCVVAWAARLGLAGLAAVLFGVVPVSAASAHDFPVDWSPEPNSTVTQPLEKVSITFDDVILDLGHDGRNSILQVTGPDPAADHFETDCATIEGRTISAPVKLGAPGQYTIAYQIVSADGHTVSGTGTFAYHPPEGTPQAEGSESSACAAAAGENAPPPTATDDEAAGTQSTAIVIVAIVGGIVLLAVIAVAIVLIVTRRRSP